MTFLKLAQAVGANFFVEDKESKTDLNIAMNKAMFYIGKIKGEGDGTGLN